MNTRTLVISGVVCAGAIVSTVLSLSGPPARHADEPTTRDTNEPPPSAASEPPRIQSRTSSQHVTDINALRAQAGASALERIRRAEHLPEAHEEQAAVANHALPRAAGAAGSGAAIVPPGAVYEGDSQGVGKAVTETMPGIRECYDKYWRHNEEPPANIRLHMTVAPDPTGGQRGVVTRVETVAGALQNGATEACLKKLLVQLNFARPKDTVDTELPLVFAKLDAPAP